MSKHVIVGAGSIGTNVARVLVERGEQVRIVTRSGSGLEHPLVERVAADASDAARLTELTRGAEVVYNCSNPTNYTMWEKLLPPINTATIAAAQANDAVLAMTGCLYAYGPQPGGLMDEHTPLAAVGHKGKLRKRLWEQAQAAGIRVFEIRGSDYVGKDAIGLYSTVLGPALEAGRTAWVPGRLDMPHTFTFNGDMARALVTLAGDERAFGRAWHVPSAPAVTIRELADRYAAAMGRASIRLVPLPRFAMHAAGLVVPIAREFAEMDYQFYGPFHMDATETAATFGLTATDLDVAIRDQVGTPLVRS
jgi:nucleoside-diphosphate-sugar epimerase